MLVKLDHSFLQVGRGDFFVNLKPHHLVFVFSVEFSVENTSFGGNENWKTDTFPKDGFPDVFKTWLGEKKSGERKLVLKKYGRLKMGEQMGEQKMVKHLRHLSKVELLNATRDVWKFWKNLNSSNELFW